MRTRISLTSGIIFVLVAVAAGAALWFAAKDDTFGERSSGLSSRFTYDIEPFTKTDPALVHYKRTGLITLSMQEPRAIYVGSDDQIYVVGDRVIQVFKPAGNKQREVTLKVEPHCLAVSAHGRVYVGTADHVQVYDAEGQSVTTWPSAGEKALFTSIAADEKDVYVADAGNRVVWHYNTAGKLLGHLGDKDEEADFRGFVIPSPYFDVAMAPDGLLRVVNPGMHSILAFTADGHVEASWGKASPDIRGFCGCCNPAAIAIFSDGRFVTAEKGIPRVKVYTADGEFESVVAGPEQFLPTFTALSETRPEHKLKVLDVAADSHHRVLVLDPSARNVQIFERK